MDENIRFLLNLQMIADEIVEKMPDVQLYTGEDTQLLEGICFYRPGMELSSRFAYVVRAEEIEKNSGAGKSLLPHPAG